MYLSSDGAEAVFQRLDSPKKKKKKKGFDSQGAEDRKLQF